MVESSTVATIAPPMIFFMSLSLSLNVTFLARTVEFTGADANDTIMRPNLSDNYVADCLSAELSDEFISLRRSQAWANRKS